jgi:hypothetical protein
LVLLYIPHMFLPNYLLLFEGYRISFFRFSLRAASRLCLNEEMSGNIRVL